MLFFLSTEAKKTTVFCTTAERYLSAHQKNLLLKIALLKKCLLIHSHKIGAKNEHQYLHACMMQILISILEV